MYKIIKEKFGNFTKVKLLNNNDGEYVSIIPEFGANINEIILKKRGELFSIIDGDKNFTELVENKWFKGAKLTPFPNRINKGTYSHSGIEYKLPINFPQGHAIHGLVYDKSFKITEENAGESEAVLTLEYTGNKLVGYPFNFSLSITLTLNSKGFVCKTLITNEDKIDIPVGDGWHPYFTLNDQIDDLFLKIPSNKEICVDNLMIPTGKKITMDKFLESNKIGEQNFDTGFVVSYEEGIAKTEITDKKSDITIQIWQETGKNKYNYLQVFIPPERKSIAIEPMSCNTDAFNNKEGLTILKPKEKFSASYGVNLI